MWGRGESHLENPVNSVLDCTLFDHWLHATAHELKHGRDNVLHLFLGDVAIPVDVVKAESPPKLLIYCSSQ